MWAAVLLAPEMALKSCRLRGYNACLLRGRLIMRRRAVGNVLHGAIGLVALLLLAWLFSENRRAPPLRIVVACIALQIALAALLTKFPPAATALLYVNKSVEALQRATDAGTGFVFGYLGGAPLPFAENRPGAGFILAFRALPLVLVISALATLLFYWGVLQKVVGAFAWLLRRSIGIGGALGLGAAAHVFVGMIEAPLLIRPYLLRMGRGELFALMTCGLAGVAGTMMVIYAAILGPIVPNALGNILVASVISTPAALAVAALMIPFRADPLAEVKLVMPDPPVGAMDAIARGTSDGIVMLANIVAMLIVIIALVALVNMALGLLPHWGGEGVTLQRLFAYVFRPVMWLIGIPGKEVVTAANLMGTKTVLNEFVAYVDLAHLPPRELSPRSALIVTYALCGFANFGSVGILVGGIGAMVPDRRREVVELGLRAMFAGTLATCMSGAVIGMV
jgi:CNT family concentrative nucleoside transporter